MAGAMRRWSGPVSLPVPPAPRGAAVTAEVVRAVPLPAVERRSGGVVVAGLIKKSAAGHAGAADVPRREAATLMKAADAGAENMKRMMSISNT